MIDSSLLVSFAALGQELHFSRAARRLGVTQPSLSQQIARLEARVGCRLLTRRPRVALTEAGTVLYRTARQTIRDIDEAVDAARRAAEGRTGLLTVGFGGSVLVTKLATAVKSFRERYPGVELRLREMPTATQLEALAAGTIDVGLGREAIEHDGLRSESILAEHFLVALPHGHPASPPSRVRLASLRHEPFVLFPRWSTPVVYDQVIGMCRRAGFSPRVVQETVEWLNALSLVAAGLGISIVPESFRKLRWEGIEYRSISPVGVSTRIYLRLRDGPGSPTVDAFRTAVRQARVDRAGHPIP